jgi:hypothetical protein
VDSRNATNKHHVLQVNPSRCAGDRATIASVPAEGELRFEMNQLLSYDDESLIGEIRRVAALAPGTHLTRNAFDRLSRAASSTIVRRFGGWQSALERAGLAGRYSGAPVSGKMRRQHGRTLTPDDIVVELQRLAADKGQPTITMHDLRSSDLLSERVVINRFGTWKAALEAAGLQLSSRGRRWTDEDYFENLLTVWTHYGRAPRYGEVDKPPSRISSGAYERKFGSWGRAKQAFVDRVNSDGPFSPPDPPTTIAPTPPLTVTADNPRSIPLRLRWKVLTRDRFRCVSCGRSPATDLECQLHVDHTVAASRGGKAEEDNLRTLCADCNLGKGDGD